MTHDSRPDPQPTAPRTAAREFMRQRAGFYGQPDILDAPIGSAENPRYETETPEQPTCPGGCGEDDCVEYVPGMIAQPEPACPCSMSTVICGCRRHWPIPVAQPTHTPTPVVSRDSSERPTYWRMDVTSSGPMVDVTDEVATLRAELAMIEARGPHFLLSDARERGHEWARRALAAEAEVERMRPVVEAACRHIDAPDGYLRLEVDAYRASEQEATDE